EGQVHGREPSRSLSRLHLSETRARVARRAGLESAGPVGPESALRVALGLFMVTFVVVVFILTYLGMALGRVPGLRLDRSGIALVAAVVLIAAEAVPAARVVHAIHFPTVLLLFALMIVSARFAAAGFYDACAAWIARRQGSPSALLALTIALGGGLS